MELDYEEKWRRIIVWVAFHSPTQWIHDDWKVVRQDILAGKFHSSQIYTHRNLNCVADKKGRFRNYDVLVVSSRDGKRRLCFHLLHPHDNNKYTELTSAESGNIVTMARF